MRPGSTSAGRWSSTAVPGGRPGRRSRASPTRGDWLRPPCTTSPSPMSRTAPAPATAGRPRTRRAARGSPARSLGRAPPAIQAASTPRSSGVMSVMLPGGMACVWRPGAAISGACAACARRVQHDALGRHGDALPDRLAACGTCCSGRHDLLGLGEVDRRRPAPRPRLVAAGHRPATDDQRPRRPRPRPRSTRARAGPCAAVVEVADDGAHDQMMPGSASCTGSRTPADSGC